MDLFEWFNSEKKRKLVDYMVEVITNKDCDIIPILQFKDGQLLLETYPRINKAKLILQDKLTQVPLHGEVHFEEMLNTKFIQAIIKHKLNKKYKINIEKESEEEINQNIRNVISAVNTNTIGIYKNHEIEKEINQHDGNIEAAVNTNVICTDTFGHNNHHHHHELFNQIDRYTNRETIKLILAEPIWPIMTNAICTNAIGIHRKTILTTIVDYDYFTERMIAHELDISQQTINHNLNHLCKAEILSKKRSKSYKINDKAFSFNIYYWNDELSEPTQEVNTNIICIHKKMYHERWETLKPAEKLLLWLDQSYSILNRRSSLDEQRLLIFRKIEQYGVHHKAIHKLADYQYFRGFKEFRSELQVLMEHESQMNNE